jgi:hypothetical protein
MYANNFISYYFNLSDFEIYEKKKYILLRILLIKSFA